MNCPMPEFGHLDFADESLDRFEGRVAVPHYGPVFFRGRKISNAPEKEPSSWRSYSLTYDDDYLRRVYERRKNAQAYAQS